MRTFVDVGAHIGQTIEEVVKWPFDEIYAIEPMPRELEVLREKFGHIPHVRIIPLALSTITGGINMYGNNEKLEASIYPQKNDVDASFVTPVNAVRATEFFMKLPEGEIYVNMNCEGAEIPILGDLIDSGQIQRITGMLLSFDIEKVVGMEYEQTIMGYRLKEIGFTRYTTEYHDGTHQEQIAAWLRDEGLSRGA